MLNNNHFTKELLEVYGFEKIDSPKNIMDSYIKNKIRLNHYFTTGTVTIQSDDGGCKTYRGIDSDEKLEEIICKIN